MASKIRQKVTAMNTSQQNAVAAPTEPRAQTATRVQIAAAKVRVAADEKTKSPTPDWILVLAGKKPATTKLAS